MSGPSAASVGPGPPSPDGAGPAARLFGFLVRLYPRRVRRRFAAEMTVMFLQDLEAARRRGRAAVASLWLRTLGHALVNGLVGRLPTSLHARRSDGDGVGAGGNRRRAGGAGRGPSSPATVVPAGAPPPRHRPAPRRRFLPGALGADLRAVLRGLRRTPVFTVMVTGTLALGVGATTAMFSVVDGVLLEPLPYPDPDRLVRLYTRFPEQGLDTFPLSAAEFFDLRQAADEIEEAAAWSVFEVALTGIERPRRIRVAAATAGIWELVGADPLLGRTFDRDDDRPGFDDVAVASHAFWQGQMDGAADAVGAALVLDGTVVEVVGVLPAGSPFPAPDVDLWVPLGIDPDGIVERSGHFLEAVGRLRRGATVDGLRAELDGIFSRWADVHEHAHPLAAVDLQTDVIGDSSRILGLLLAAVGLVLLIACANAAALLATRAHERGAEVAIRRALGASRGRVAAQLLVESAVVAAAGGLLGVGLASQATRFLLALEPGDLPRAAGVGLDGTVLAFAFGLCLIAGLGAGLAPALGAMRTPPGDALREGGGRSGAAGRRRRFQQAMVVAEIAVAVVLLVGAGLLLRSLGRLLDADHGLDAAGVLTSRISLPSSRYPLPSDLRSFTARLLDGLEALPGVEAAGTIRSFPLVDPAYQELFLKEGETDHDGHPAHRFDYQVVAGDYFPAAGIPLLSGRLFDGRDRAGSPRVALLNEAAARAHFPGEDPVGARIRILAADRRDEPFEVVGVVADVRQESLSREASPQVFVPHAQATGHSTFASRSQTLVLRTTADPTALIPGVRRAVQSLDADLPVARELTVDQAVARSASRPRFVTTLLSVFSGLALLLAAVGTYGVVSHGVARRSREYGVRMALGARPGDVRSLVVRRALIPVAGGLLAGILLALALSRSLETLLFEIAPTDTASFAAAAALLLGVGLGAAWLPAARATRVDPAVTLRDG